jgi:flagellar motility protein MotE (MotC chaperone)
LFDETVQVYKRDRSALLQGENERREKDQAKIQELLKKIEKLEEFNRENVKGIFCITGILRGTTKLT